MISSCAGMLYQSGSSSQSCSISSEHAVFKAMKSVPYALACTWICSAHFKNFCMHRSRKGSNIQKRCRWESRAGLGPEALKLHAVTKSLLASRQTLTQRQSSLRQSASSDFGPMVGSIQQENLFQHEDFLCMTSLGSWLSGHADEISA